MNSYEPLGRIELHPHDCEKYPSCNANVCPLDPDWQERTYIKGETICFYMLEAQKENVQPRFRGTIEVLILEAAYKITQHPQCIHSPLKRRLELANETRSRRVKR